MTVVTVLPRWRRTIAIVLLAGTSTLGAESTSTSTSIWTSASAYGGRPSVVFVAMMLGALVDFASAYSDRPSTSEKGCKFMTPFHPVNDVRTQSQTGFIPYEVRPKLNERGRSEDSFLGGPSKLSPLFFSVISTNTTAGSTKVGQLAKTHSVIPDGS